MALNTNTQEGQELMLQRLGAGAAANAVVAEEFLENLDVARSTPTAAERIFQLACWGDSLTAGMGVNSYSYPEKLFRRGWRVYQGGVGGETSTQIRDRFLAAPQYHTWPTVICAGRNGAGSGRTVLADVQEMVAALVAAGNQDYLILSIPNQDVPNEYQGQPGYNGIIALNASLAAAFGDRYYDLRAYEVAQYNPLIAQDVIDHGHDVPPSSLRRDALHENEAGAIVRALEVERQLGQKVAVMRQFLENYGIPVSVANPFVQTLTSQKTTDSVNYERFVQNWSGGIYQLGSTFAGGGAARSLILGVAVAPNNTPSQGRTLTINANPPFHDFNHLTTGSDGMRVRFQGVVNGTANGSGVAITPTYNQSGAASQTDLLINRTETAVGSGAQNLIDAQVGGASKFKVSRTGKVTHVSPVFADNTTAIAGGLVAGDQYKTPLGVRMEVY